MLGSAIQSAVASASSPATSAVASASPVSAVPGNQAQSSQPAQSTTAPSASSNSSGSAAPSSLLAPPVMHQVSRAIMHVISPLVTAQTAPPSTSAVASAAAAVTQAGGTDPSSNNPPAEAQRLISMLMGAGASSVDVSGPMTVSPEQAGPTSATTTSTADRAEAPTAGSPPESGKTDAAGDQSSSQPAAAASHASSGSGGQRPSQRAMGLGSALPPREKGSKKSHPRSPMPTTLPSSPDEAAGNRQPGGRQDPSLSLQDNVKRARHGDNTRDAPSTSSSDRSVSAPAAGSVQPAASSRAGSEEEEEIQRPARGGMQAGSAGGLDAIMAQMFGGGSGGPAGGSESGGLNLNSLVQVRLHMHALGACLSGYGTFFSPCVAA